MRAIHASGAVVPGVADPDWMTQFFAGLAREDLSPATLCGYRYDLWHFLRWHHGVTGAPFAPDRLAEYDLIAYLWLPKIVSGLAQMPRWVILASGCLTS